MNKYKIFNIISKLHLNRLWGYFSNPITINGYKYMTIGNSGIGRGTIISAIDKYNGIHYSPKIIIGNNCSIGEFSHITACKEVRIGNHVLMGRLIYI